MCILCALLACVGEPVASPGPPGVAHTLEPGQTQMRHPGDHAVSIMGMHDLSLASWECYFPITIRDLVPRVLYIISVEVDCLGGAQGAADDGGSNNDCGNVYFVEERIQRVRMYTEFKCGWLTRSPALPLTMAS